MASFVGATTIREYVVGYEDKQPTPEQLDEMRELEARADREYGLTSQILMENAGKSAAELLVQHIRRQRSLNDTEFLILVGPGNNGGDGLVMGRYLQKWGGLVNLYRWKEQRLTIAGQDVPEQETAAQLEEVFQRTGYVLDALLGTGRSRPLPDSMRGLLARARQEREKRDTLRVVAVDSVRRRHLCRARGRSSQRAPSRPCRPR